MALPATQDGDRHQTQDAGSEPGFSKSTARTASREMD
jgi:hypothetical protein